jgi:hypothetical protein
MRTLLAIVALLIALPASAVVSIDVCSPECETHQLEWRVNSLASWSVVGAPVAVTDVTRPDNGNPDRGVEWTGISDVGEFRGKSTRTGSVDSDWSTPIFVGEPAAPPLLLSGLFTLWLLRPRERAARTT